MEKLTLGPICSFLGFLSFLAFGILACVNLKAPFDPMMYGIAILVGLSFATLHKRLLITLLYLFNRDVRKAQGNDIIRKVVRRSRIFMFPFALLFFIATYFLDWTGAAVFFSAAATNCGVLLSMEMAKLKGKPAMINTIAASVASGAIGFLWMFSVSYLTKIPMIAKGALAFILPVILEKLGVKG